jgi:uncharacterized damage-inducible protein DinB
MNTEGIIFLFNYSYWARDQILENAAQISAAEYLEPRAYAHGSIRDTLVHTLNAEWVWRRRCQEGVSPSQPLDPQEFATLPVLQQKWQQEEALMLAYLGNLTSVDLEKTIEYKSLGGEPQQNTLWHILLHVVNHGTEHRSVLASYLTACGRSPGDIDIIHYLRVI